ncbi:MAG: hypothetical protein KJ927_07905 [Candidatus Eisenbacteria bacterium]|nr:hypothetical protein [Candidatus Eisenbacteria bacterium]MBU1948617.1 hypothetical protein [Candidatus Eisenbacteria bacterium]
MSAVSFFIPMLLIPMLLIPSNTYAASKRIKSRDHAGVVKLRIGKKLTTYYKATHAKPLTVRVSGPIPIRILSRYIYPDTPLDEQMAYHMSLEIDGVEIRTVVETTGPSTLKLRDGSPVGTLQASVAQIPAGDHRITIRPVDEGAAIALRVFRGLKQTKKEKWISYAPEKYLQPIVLKGTDSEVTYYRFDDENPVEVTMIGPLSLRVLTRIDFAPQAGYTQSYVVRTLLDGEHWKSFHLQARASHTLTYPDLPEISPGRNQEISMQVADGEHKITLFLTGATASAASLRILVPEKELLRDSGGVGF